MAPPLLPARVRQEDLPISFGRYDLLEILGEGGMGRVFGARLRGPSGFSRPVALKMLLSEAAGGPTEKDLFNEARIGGLLRHPNIVAIHDCGIVDGHAFIVMEWVEHLTLAALLSEWGALPAAAVADLALQACAGLVYAHGLEMRGRKAGLIHRDLKPGNLLVSHDGTVKLADLGLARTRLYSEESTLSDGLRGTPPYMSPEQVMEEALDHRSDQFSLGIILYEAATGRRLFQGGVLEILLRVRSPRKELNRPLHRKRLSGVGPRLRAIILRCLEEDPDKRWQSTEELFQEIEFLQAGLPMAPRLAHIMEEVSKTEWSNTAFDELPEGLERHIDTIVHLGGQVDPRTNLPASAHPIFGREQEEEAVLALLADGERLVTLKGLGGMGKTRLACEVGARMLAHGAAGVWFCDLSEVSTLSGLIHQVAASLEVPLVEGEESEQLLQLGRALGGRGDWLFVLDNLEQVIEPARRAIEVWLSEAVECRFLLTSRQVVGHEREQVVELGGLTSNHAVSLLLEYVPSERRQAISKTELQALSEAVTNALEGVPLALEIAAAWMGRVPGDELIADLARHMEHPTGEGSEKRPQGATVQGTLDWSWKLMAPWEQEALAQLSVFRGGFFLESAEEVLDLFSHPDAPWTVAVIESLCDKSLLFARLVGDQPRFGMYESVRKYARLKLQQSGAVRSETGESLTGLDAASFVALRHARHIARLGERGLQERKRVHGGVLGRRLLLMEVENLMAAVGTARREQMPRVAVRACLAAMEALQAVGPVDRAVSLADEVEQIPGISIRDRVLLGLEWGWCLHLSGRGEEGLLKVREALEHATELGEQRLEAKCRDGLSRQLLQLGKLKEAGVELEAGLALAGDSGALRAGLLEGKGTWCLRRGQAVEADRLLGEALRQAREHGALGIECLVLSDLGKLRREQGNMKDAARFVRDALERYRALQDQRMEGRELASLGLILSELGEVVEAREKMNQAYDLARAVGDVRSEGSILGNMAILEIEHGVSDRALDLYKKALQIHREVGDVRSEGIVLGNLGVLYQEGGASVQAREVLRDALAIHEQLNNRRFEAVTHGNLGDSYLRDGLKGPARHHLENCLLIAREVGWKAVEGAFLGAMGELVALEGRLAEAESLLNQGEGMLEAVGHRVELSKLVCRRARVWLGAGRINDARVLLERVRADSKALGARKDSPLGRSIRSLEKRLAAQS